MDHETIGQRRLVKWTLILLGWTFLGVFYAGQTYLIYARSNHPTRLARILPGALVIWYSWAVLSPFIIWLARHFRIERKRLLRNLATHLAAGIFFSFLHQAVPILVFSTVDIASGKPSLFFSRLFNSLFSLYFSNDFFIYWMILFAVHALDYYRRYREGELKASRLEGQLAQAQLQALKMQLHPHFLFNTLHAISALVHKDPEVADRMIARLSDLLRLTLDSVGVQEVPLRQELDFLERYLEIEQQRFQDRLKVHLEVDPRTLDAMVPNLILQPLVENAIRHGIAQRSSPGRVEIRARREDTRLRLEVRDDGSGLEEGASENLKEGIGLGNTRARLEQLYGAAHHFDLSNASKGGLVVSLMIPFRTESQGGRKGHPDEYSSPDR
ncbi:MAG: histidine kinase [Acidobacteriia bacterium]|nr:histidine kinase [Terriglobia bacterium]